MKKVFLSLILVSLTCHIQAQLIINNHVVHYDSYTNSWLATIPETMFGKDCQLSITIQDGWNSLTIDNQLVGNQYTFKEISAKSTYQTSITDADGNTVSGALRFTFLPIIHLDGLFGYEYQQGTVTISIPNEKNDHQALMARIKWRGGTTNTNEKHKRNYSIKFDTDIKLFGMRKDNNWMLDAGQPDVFRMRNRIAMDLWNDMAYKPYYADKEPKALNGVRGCMVEVFLNNEYRGIYNFSEKMDRKQLKLKKVDDWGNIHGVLYKAKTWYNATMFDSIYNYNNYDYSLMGFEVKYPKPYDDCDSTDWKPLVDTNNNILFLSLNDEEYEKQIEEWFDIPAMIDYGVFLSSVNALDNGGKNMYWAVYDKTISKKMTLAPWDLDCTFGQRWGGIMVTEEADQTSPYYLTDVALAGFFHLYRTNALHFNDRLNERYQTLRKKGNVLSTDSLIQRVTQYYHLIKNSGAAQRETNKWSGDSDIMGEEIDFDKEYNYICDWITKHMEAIDKKGFPVLYDKEFIDSLYAGIPNKTIINKTDNHIYTLSGQRVNPTQQLKHGIYIVNKKKVIY